MDRGDRGATAVAGRSPTATRHANLDAVHDLLLRLGDLNAAERAATMRKSMLTRDLRRLLRAREFCRLGLPASHASSRLRMLRGCVMRSVLPLSPVFLRPFSPQRRRLLSTLFVDTRAPRTIFTTVEVAKRYALSNATIEPVLQRLVGMGRIVEGGFRPSGVNREWIDVEVLRTIRRRSLARLRKEVEPVERRNVGKVIHTLARGCATAERTRCAAGCDRDATGCGVAGLCYLRPKSCRRATRVMLPRTWTR